jgi:hypothetical protein
MIANQVQPIQAVLVPASALNPRTERAAPVRSGLQNGLQPATQTMSRCTLQCEPSQAGNPSSPEPRAEAGNPSSRRQAE